MLRMLLRVKSVSSGCDAQRSFAAYETGQSCHRYSHGLAAFGVMVIQGRSRSVGSASMRMGVSVTV